MCMQIVLHSDRERGAGVAGQRERGRREREKERERALNMRSIAVRYFAEYIVN